MTPLRKFTIAGALVAVGSTWFLGCEPAPREEPYQPVVGNRLLMVSVIDPAADFLWDAVWTLMTEEGTTEYRPETEEEWTLVRNAAVVLAESGNLLMMGRRAVDQGDWIGWSQRLVEAGEAAMQAAEARDPEAIFDIGEEVYFSCAGCHEQYWRGDFAAPPVPSER